MRVFVAVAEEASFAAGARKLSLSPARVTRAVAALEAALGARLLHRTTRIVRLTEGGSAYLADCKRILSDIVEAEAVAASSQAELVGQLAVTAPVLLGRLCVAPVLLAFSRRHARVSMRVLLSDQVVDLQDQNIDVAVRIAHLADSGLSAIKLGSVRRVLCASPSYLRAHGVPRQPSELAHHQLIAFSAAGPPGDWHFLQAGKALHITPRPRLTVNNVDLAISAALAGHGIARVHSYQVAQAVQQKKLRVVLADYELPPIPVQLVHREGRGASARVRAFVDYAVAELRAFLSESA